MLSSHFAIPRPLIVLAICSLLLAALPMHGTSAVTRANAPSAVKPNAGKSFRDCPNCPEMVVVPGGSFGMGSPDNGPGSQIYERPRHTVVFAKPFAVGKFAVTFAEWDACVRGGGCAGYTPDDAGWGRGDRPVINVRWNDAKAYAGWLAQKTGHSYRLLSEAEREYVARAGTTSPFWWGAEIKADQANYDRKQEKTVPVKSYQPNPWGLYQVHGNIWEWVEDCWNDSYEGAPAGGSAWTSEGCSMRVLRGGSWGSNFDLLRSAYRSNYFPGLRDTFTGFRVARSLD